MSTTSRRRRPTALVVLAAATSLAMLGVAAPAFAHGWIGGSGSELVARQAMPGNGDIGLVQYEPQSLEAPGGFPETGPADGHLASAGIAQFSELDEQTATRWAKNEITPGPHRFGWTYTAPHNTDQWRYYITKNGWNPNEPLKRSSFELLQVVAHDHSAANTNPVHTITIPSDHSGYHVVLAVWEVWDTPNAFYNVVDVDISGSPGSADTQAPTAPTSVRSTATSSSSVGLAWTASTDDRGVTGYRVERATASGAFAQVAQVSGTSTLDAGLVASTAYRYRVAAVDAAGNVSPYSAVLSVTTAAGSGTGAVPAWNPSGAYAKGDRVSHGGVVYEAVLTHQGSGDPGWITARSLWKPVG
ncbi:chitin-binding protein [Agromyces terreus]|uniref:Chitin-binding protein n=1 Tax=Agromyces terreus TaxID=424795 RepID=A0A9X2H4G5_9MICO|nr:lytic polysaccharide monooxygenase [Agromyces terreus]MCP2370622.1 chitin-binding protein [Agromyces terreus]